MFLFFACLLAGIFVMACRYVLYRTQPPHISSIDVINLDRDRKRWESIQSQGERLGLDVRRFPAIYGKDIPYTRMRSLGVGNAMVRANRHDHKGESLHNLGVVGCFLSHRSLLESLATRNVPESDGHLILEDDVQLPEDFLQANGRWDRLRRGVPHDWDIISFRMWHPNGKEVAPGVWKLTSDPSKRTNLGAFAYVVRHGSIRTKLLPWLHYMNDAYDEQLNLQFGAWNVYLLHPGIIDIHDELQKDSSINAINVVNA